MKFIAKYLVAAIGAATMFVDAKEAVPAPSVEAGTMPPSRYVTDYYAPTTDWLPKREIKDYTVQTRVPDLFWLKYDGANTLALRMKPITKEMLARQMKAELIFNKNATNFTAKLENDEANRTIGVFDINVPADDFIEFSFKAKNTALENAGGNLWVYSDGLFKKTKIADCVDKETACKDGFTAYKIKISPKSGAKLKNIAFILDKATADGYKQEWIVMDLLFRRSAPKARFTDVPQRQWILKADFDKDPAAITTANGIKDAYTFINSNPEGLETIPLSLDWDKAYDPKDKGSCDNPATYKPTPVTETINGKTYKGIRFTLQMGMACYVRFPMNFNAEKYNTLSFLTKIDLPADLKFRNTQNNYVVEEGARAGKALLGDDYQRCFGSDNTKMNLHFDSFGFGYGSKKMDIEEWCKYGHAQGSVAQSWQRGAAAPEGWKAVVFDAVNDVFIGNKNSWLKETSYWAFYYDTKKIAPGQTVTVTILDPKATSGLMYAGGNLVKHAAFLKWRESYKPGSTNYKEGKKYLGAPEKGRLKKKIEIVDNHKPKAEFIVTYGTPEPRYRTIVERAIDRLNSLFVEKYQMTTNFPVLTAPSKADNTKIYIGGDAYAKVNKNEYDADMKRLKGTDGFAVRADGDEAIYIYAAPFNFAGDSRGLANGIYTWIMNNTDIICTGAKEAEFVFDIEKSGDMDAVWGDDIQISPLAVRGPGIVEGSYTCNDFNRCTRTGVWCDAAIGGHRPRSTCHWWGYGTRLNMDGSRPEKGALSDTCGLDENGKRMPPGCYTGHPCLVSVLDNAKNEYVDWSFSPVNGCGTIFGYVNPPKSWSETPMKNGYGWNRYDIYGLWVEDSQTLCQCEKCFTPIRLPNGELLKRPRSCQSMKEGEFLSTQFYANGSAMINQVNVYANRKMKVESIAYFWMQEPPAINISRNYYVRFCPYIRKDYMEPIFSPANDIWYRNLYRWGQLDCGLSTYEYTLLYQVAHPVADVFQRELQAEVEECGLEEMFFEPGPAILPDNIERWTILQLMWDPYQDVEELRRTFIRRAFREAAPEMEKFFTTINYANYQAGPNNRIEFEMEAVSAIILNSMPARDGKGGTLLDECTRYLEAAMKNVKNEKARLHVEKWYKGWPKFVKCGKRQ